MLIENNKKRCMNQTIYDVTLEVSRYIKVDESQYITCKNKYFDFTESHYYLKDVLYKVTLKKHGDGVYLSKEVVKK